MQVGFLQHFLKMQLYNAKIKNGNTKIFVYGYVTYGTTLKIFYICIYKNGNTKIFVWIRNI